MPAVTPVDRKPPESVGVKAMDPAALASLLAQMGQPTFRAGQIIEWLYARRARSWDEMTNLPAALRARLSEKLSLPYPEVLEKQISSDGTRKYLLGLADGTTVEAVGLPSGDRLTVCFSTQAGCAMGCSFCATGDSGLTRDLGPGEIVDQVSVVAEDFGGRVSNAVAMGQGEPFANYDATLAALRILNSKHGPEIGARHLTVSTCGLVPGIMRFANEPEQFTLAVSLHSAVQETRDQLMPGLRGTDLAALRDALIEYARLSGRRPSVEFALIAGVNDAPEELEALVEFCRGMLVHVNLIPINAVTGTRYRRSGPQTADAFVSALAAAGTEATVRLERGGDIDAACGQLRQRSGS